MRRFVLNRKEDVTGVSGTGVVAEGVLFSTGWVALTWLTSVNSLVFYPAMENVYHIHGHDGRTQIEWIDKPEGADWPAKNEGFRTQTTPPARASAGEAG